MENILSSDLNDKNKEILRYLYNKGYFFKKYSELDKALGVSKGYMSKVASPEEVSKKLTKVQTIALEYIFKIPQTLFFNEAINTFDDIEKEIERSKHRFGIYVQNRHPYSLDKFKEYQNFYMFDRFHNEIIKRQIYIQNQYVEIRKVRNGKLNYSGFIDVSDCNLIMVTVNPTTGNSAIFKVQRNSLIDEDIIPISYLGHRTNTNEEIVGYGICSIGRIDSNKDIKSILDIDKGMDFSKKREEIIKRIKEYNKTRVEEN